jgi:polar amino acid transport system substrate-binding protein
MDIMEEIGEVLGYKIEVRDIDFEQILNEVANNKNAVGAAGMTKNPDRDLIALSSISYATSVQYAIVAKGTFTEADLVDGKLPLAKLATLSNKKIGTQTGTTGYYMVDDAINLEDGDLYGKNASCFTYKNAIIASQDIGSQIGSVVIDKLPAQTICASNSNLECFELDAEPESYVLYFNKEATALVEKVNAVLATMIENGVIDYFTIKHSGGITD